MTEPMPTVVQVACASCTGLASLTQCLWLAVAMLTLTILVTMLDLYFIWRRCNERKKLIRQRLRRRSTDGIAQP